MKRFLLCLTTLFIFPMLCMPASAHPGKTDADGGHYDQETGEYHYHHGYPAHAHYDMDGDGDVDCPYDFDDKTDRTPNLSQSSSAYKKPVQTTPANSTVFKARANQKEETVIPIKFFLIIDGILILIILVFFLKAKWRKEELESITTQAKEEADHKQQLIKKSLKELDSDLSKKWGETYLYQLCNAPTTDCLGPDDLPRTLAEDGEKWGQKYTFYLSSPYSNYSPNGKYHRSICRYANHNCPINAFSIQHTHQTAGPCSKCKPTLPDTQWVSKYLQYKLFLNQFDISVPTESLATDSPQEPINK